MGLTIHWSFKCSQGGRTVQTKLAQLRSACLNLPFEEVGELFCPSGSDVGRILVEREHPLRWAVIQAEESVTVENVPSFERSMRVPPQELIVFSAWPGEGCEEANFFLGRYPTAIECDGLRILTGLEGWMGAVSARPNMPPIFPFRISCVAT